MLTKKSIRYVLIFLIIFGFQWVVFSENISDENINSNNIDDTIESESSEEPKPWENIYISDNSLINEKLNFYKKMPETSKVIGNGKLIKLYNFEMPSFIEETLKYTSYPTGSHYFLVLESVINVRETPSFNSKVRMKKYRYQRMDVDALIQGEYSSKSDSDRWYRVYWDDKNGRQYGYVFEKSVKKREFQFDKMFAVADLLKTEVDSNKTAYIENYKNVHGWAPKYKGESVDEYGAKRDQSAPAYFHDGDQTEFRYMTDGTLLSIFGETEEFFKVTAVGYEGMYFVPKKYVNSTNSIEELEKVVVVDRNNQNEVVLEFTDGKWSLISKMLATTGVKAEHKEETDLGYFMVSEKKSKFLYLDDITKEISGYAPFAIRFNGGAYVHGVPVNFKLVKQTRVVVPAIVDEFGGIIVPEVTEEVIVDRLDPGHSEYLSSIGTTPRSHKCVRNYTSHAKFIYDWTEIGKTAVIVIE